MKYSTMLATLLVACGDSGESSGSGGAGGNGGDCELSMPVSGGLNATLTANGCGTSGKNVVSLADVDFASSTSIAAVMTFMNDLEGGKTGDIPLDTLKIRTKDKNDVFLEWEVPTGACTVEFSSNVSAPTQVFKNRYIITGSGSCSEAAEPIGGNSEPAISIGNFSFKAFINP